MPETSAPADSKNAAGAPTVVVLGAGLAGHAAALEAAGAGADVLLIDKDTRLGGSTVRSGGSFAFAGTDLQARAGIADSADRLRSDLLSCGGEQCDPALVDLYVERQAEAYDWLRGLGADFVGVSLSGEQSVPRSHGVDIRRTFDRIAAAAAANPSITVRLGETPERLLSDGTAVTGVVARTPTGQAEYPAAAVVLATGGFARGDRALRTFAPHLHHARRMGGELNAGDGLYLAMSLGADLADVGSIKATFGVTADIPAMPPEPILLIALYQGAIAVNAHARRFVDESISYKQISGVCLDQPGGIAIQVFDQKIMDQTIPTKAVNNFAGALERGYLLTAETIPRLARESGLDPRPLQDTIDRYNAGVTAGHDPDFGRACLGGGYGERTLIDRPPFYAYPSTGGLLSTYGGLRVDRAMRVQHVLGGAVTGLYAAGEIVGGFHGNGYMSGTSLGKCVIFGRVAGAAAANAAGAAPQHDRQRGTGQGH